MKNVSYSHQKKEDIIYIDTKSKSMSIKRNTLIFPISPHISPFQNKQAQWYIIYVDKCLSFSQWLVWPVFTVAIR